MLFDFESIFFGTIEAGKIYNLIRWLKKTLKYLKGLPQRHRVPQIE